MSFQDAGASCTLARSCGAAGLGVLKTGSFVHRASEIPFHMVTLKLGEYAYEQELGGRP